MKIFTLVPAYNEKENVEKLISQLEDEFKKQKIQFKIFFVIQGNDGSRKLLEDLKKKKQYLDFIYFEKPLGIGNAYKVGYSKVEKTADYILTMDADLNHDIRDLPKFIKAIKDTKSDLVIGSRFVAGGKFDDKRIWKKIASRLANKIVTTILQIDVKDISSGYRLMRKEVAGKVHPKLINSGYPSYMEFILRARRLGYKITEIPIIYHRRIWGRSKISSIGTMVDYFRFLLALVFSS